MTEYDRLMRHEARLTAIIRCYGRQVESLEPWQKQQTPAITAGYRGTQFDSPETLLWAAIGRASRRLGRVQSKLKGFRAEMANRKLDIAC